VKGEAVSDENSLTEGGVPDSFWSVPEQFITDQNLRLLHADSCQRLRQDNPDADTLELMAIERVTSLYFYMRSKEATGTFNSDTAYKGMMQLWVTMAADLRKARTGASDVESIRADVLKSVVRAVNGAFEGLEPEVAKTVKKRIAERLERV
jgi:hypothetical protein